MNGEKLTVALNEAVNALFGDEEEVTPEMWDEVKRFAEFVKTKHKGDKK